MAIETLIIWLIIGAVAGWLAGQIVTGGGFGLIGNIVVGIIGAFVAGWLLPATSAVFIGGSVVGDDHQCRDRRGHRAARRRAW